MNTFNSSKYIQGNSKGGQEVVYSDIPINFDFHPGTKDLARVTDEQAVKNSLRSILKTSRYERLFNPFFGANLNRMLFENLDERNIDNIETLIRTSIENFEPRVILKDVVVGGLVDDSTLAIDLIYSIRNNTGEQRLSLSITRVR